MAAARRALRPPGPAAGGAGASPHAGTRVLLDYRVEAKPRWGYGTPPHPELHRLIASRESAYREQLESFLPFVDELLAIPLDPDGLEPGWHNGWYQGLDAVALYCLLAIEEPRRYLEVGSGNSTKFARRAIRDRGLRTRITSIDPEPRAEVDGLCDRTVRSRLEDADLGHFDELKPGDFLHVDGSHRSLMNSDATVLFTEILPRLPSGVVVQVHDVFLPWDYPAQMADRYYSEQYLLASWLLAGGPLEILLPCFYICTEPSLHHVLDALWGPFTWSATPENGTGFWMRIT